MTVKKRSLYTPPKTVGTVARIAGILRHVAEHDRDVTISEMASKFGLATSTVHRLLALLTGLSLVVKSENRRYRGGPELYRMARLLAAHRHITPQGEAAPGTAHTPSPQSGAAHQWGAEEPSRTHGSPTAGDTSSDEGAP